MSYKARVVGAAQEILKCRIKDLAGPATKIVALPYETYLTLRKEMEIELLEVIQAGKPEAYADRLRNITGKDKHLPSRRAEFKKPSEKEIIPVPTDDRVAVADVPPPPIQNKQRLPGEEQGEFHARRMREGKAYKKWEAEHGEAYAGASSAESVSASQTPRDGSESEAETIGSDPDGTPGDQAADPIKEAIERASMEQLEQRNQ